MKQIEDFVFSAELLHQLITTEAKTTNIPKDGRIRHLFYDEQNMTLRIRIEHETLKETPEGCHVLRTEPTIEK